MSSVDRASMSYISDRVSADMHVGGEATYIDQHIGRVSTDILVECRSIYRTSVDRQIGRVSIDISAECRSIFQ